MFVVTTGNPTIPWDFHFLNSFTVPSVQKDTLPFCFFSGFPVDDKFHPELPQRKRVVPSLQSFIPGGAVATHDVFAMKLAISLQ
jgi:hypothetical protein